MVDKIFIKRIVTKYITSAISNVTITITGISKERELLCTKSQYRWFKGKNAFKERVDLHFAVNDLICAINYVNSNLIM